jgi:hypothetical protein
VFSGAVESSWASRKSASFAVATTPLAATAADAKPHCRHLRLLYATASLSLYQGQMIVSMSHRQLSLRATTRLALVGLGVTLGLGLGGCAVTGDSLTEVFADPAKYEYYDCKQLETERKALTQRAETQKTLMAKADTGVAGPVVAEMVYRNEYLAIRGQMRFADEAWRLNKCKESPPGATPATPAPDVTPAPPAKHRGSH